MDERGSWGGMTSCGLQSGGCECRCVWDIWMRLEHTVGGRAGSVNRGDVPIWTIIIRRVRILSRRARAGVKKLY